MFGPHCCAFVYGGAGFGNDFFLLLYFVVVVIVVVLWCSILVGFMSFSIWFFVLIAAPDTGNLGELCLYVFYFSSFKSL